MTHLTSVCEVCWLYLEHSHVAPHSTTHHSNSHSNRLCITAISHNVLLHITAILRNIPPHITTAFCHTTQPFHTTFCYTLPPSYTVFCSTSQPSRKAFLIRVACLRHIQGMDCYLLNASCMDTAESISAACIMPLMDHTF